MASTDSGTLAVAVTDEHGKLLLEAVDFATAGVDRLSPVNTKNRIAISHSRSSTKSRDMIRNGVKEANVTTTYYQVTENVLGARLAIGGTPPSASEDEFVTVVMHLQLGAHGANTTFIGSYHQFDSRVLVQGGPAPGYWGAFLQLVVPTYVPDIVYESARH